MARMKPATVLYNYGGTIRMPGNFRVKVELLDKHDAKDQMGSQVLAQYSQDDHVISLKKNRTSKQRKSDLEHELQHCCVDWIDHFMRKSKAT